MTTNVPLRESDIRSESLSVEYLTRLRRDAERLAAKRAGFVDVTCTSCGSWESEATFEKDGFPFRECRECGTLFASPRPTARLLAEYLDTSEAAEFWSTRFYPETASARRVAMFRPRAAEVAAIADRYGLTRPAMCADIGAGYGLFLLELRDLHRFDRILAVEPDAGLATVCRDHGFEVVEKRVEDLGPGDVAADIVTAFEVMEHVFDPLAFLQSAGRAVRPGGLLVWSTLASTGFDIRALWAHSRSVSPPQHLNFPSIDGARRLVERAGLEVVEMSTPGRIDVDIVRNRIAVDPSMPVSRFAALIARADEATRQAFQRFLQEHLLSSHVHCIARRPG